MNEVPQQSKDTVLRILAILGFLAVIVIGILLAIQVVHLAPKAFSSLASIAQNIHEYRPTADKAEELVITLNGGESLVNSGESFTLEFDPLLKSGAYILSYECTEGIAVDVQAGDRTKPVNCENGYEIPADTNQLTMFVSSERNRFTDIEFSVTHIDDENRITTAVNDTITVLNSSIPESQTELAANISSEEEEPAAEDIAVADTPPLGLYPSEPKPAPAAPAPVTPAPQPIIDLVTTFIAVGELDDDNFIETKNLTEGHKGAIRFVVTNAGTLTSDVWTFTTTLPSGTIYNSKPQVPLKPGEFAVMTVGFSDIGTANNHQFDVNVLTKDDVYRENNAFSKLVKITH